MLLSTRIKLVLALWFVGEALLFVLVARLIGYPLAFLLGIATSLIGVRLLKRAGASAMIKLRAALDGRTSDGASGRVLDDTLATLGALALVLPGFLSDIVGLALITPAVRDRVVDRIDKHGLRHLRPGGARASRGPVTIDLEADEWRRSEPSSPRMRRVSEL